MSFKAIDLDKVVEYAAAEKTEQLKEIDFSQEFNDFFKMDLIDGNYYEKKEELLDSIEDFLEQKNHSPIEVIIDKFPGVNRMKWLKALKERYGGANGLKISVKATKEEWKTASNEFASGVKWIEVEENELKKVIDEKEGNYNEKLNLDSGTKYLFNVKIPGGEKRHKATYLKTVKHESGEYNIIYTRKEDGSEWRFREDNIVDIDDIS